MKYRIYQLLNSIVDYLDDTKSNEQESLKLYTGVDDTDMVDGAGKPGLWDNIRKKKEREGKNYKPAKTLKEGRPTKEAWNDLTKKKS